MWESRVLCEISKARWKPFCGFHRAGISIAVSRGREDVDGEIVQDQEVDGEQFAELGLIAVIQAGMFQRLEHLIGPEGEHARRPAARDMAEGVREKGFADADGPDDRDVRMRVEKA